MNVFFMVNLSYRLLPAPLPPLLRAPWGMLERPRALAVRVEAPLP
jgi:hypothetical protein